MSYKVTYDGVTVTIENGTIPEDEIEAYIKRGKEFYGNGLIAVRAVLDLDDPEMVELHYDWKEQPFHRLRRITGYLVGNLGRWNNAKRAEERDRVKHGGKEE